MEGQAKIMWDFLETAFRTGTLDELLKLVQVATGKGFEDLSQSFANVEDVFMDMEDTSSFEENFGKIYEIMEALTDDEVIEGLGILLSLLNPLISTVMEKTGKDTLLSAEMQEELKEKSQKIIKALKALGSLGSKMVIANLGNKSPKELGQNLGKAINSLTSFTNGIYAEDSGAVSDFMTGVFDVVDGDAMREMAETLTDGFLDQRPPLLKWTAATAVKRAKKRLLNK